jgi:hypothetical protein
MRPCASTRSRREASVAIGASALVSPFSSLARCVACVRMCHKEHIDEDSVNRQKNIFVSYVAYARITSKKRTEVSWPTTSPTVRVFQKYLEFDQSIVYIYIYIVKNEI